MAARLQERTATGFEGSEHKGGCLQAMVHLRSRLFPSEGDERLLALLPAAVYMCDADGIIQYYNPRAAEFWGRKPKIGDPAERYCGALQAFDRDGRLLPPDETPMGKVLRTGCGRQTCEAVLRRPDDSTLYVSVSVDPLYDEAGQLIGAINILQDISDRFRADEAERLLSALVESSEDAIFGKTLDGIITHWNAAAQRMYGYSSEEIIGQSIKVLVPDDRRDELDDVMRRLQRGERIESLDTERCHKNGSRIRVSVTISPIRNRYGTLVGASAIARDISDRLRAEQKVRASEEQLRVVTEHAPLLLVRCDRSHRYRFANRRYAALFGRQPEQLAGKQIAEVMGRATFERLRPHIEETLSGSAVEFECEMEFPDIGMRTVHASYVPEREPSGDVVGWVGVITDITERTQFEQQREELEQRFLQLAENIADVFYITDTRTAEIIYISRAYERIWGRSCESLYAQPHSFLEVIHESDRARVARALQRQRRGENTAEEYRVVQPDGRWRWIWDRAFPVRDALGQVIRVAGIAEDVTERKRLEQDLRFLAEASQVLASLVDFESTLQRIAQLAVPVFADWCSVHIAADDGSLRQLAVAHTDPAKVALAVELGQRYQPDPDAVAGAARVLRTRRSEMVSEIPDSLIRTVSRDAEHLAILRTLGLRSYMCVPLTVRERVIGVITFVAAESGRRYTQDDLAVAEDLAHRAAVAIENAQLYAELRTEAQRKDDFLAMLAHELRNPLAPIRTGLDVLQLSGETQDVVGTMHRQVEHLVRIVDDLLDISRIMRNKVQLRREPTLLADVLRRAVEAAQPLIDQQGHQLELAGAGDLLVNGDPVRLAQVFANLLHNAAKYTPPAGRIWVQVEPDGEQVTVQVRDTGIGMHSQFVSRAFDLFAQADRTLERSQGGLGVGLTLVKSLVELHGGTVRAWSAGEGKGSEFTVRLPLVEGCLMSKDTSSGRAETGARRILVVDDNIDAARMLSLLLRALGPHEVLLAHDGPGALVAARQHQPDVVLLDIGLPGMSGYEVAEGLRQDERVSDSLLVAVTGYGTEADQRRARAAGFDLHLVKPVAVDVLQEVLAHPKLAH